MVRKLIVAVIGIGIFAAVGLWLFTAPRALSAADVPPHTGDPVHGEQVFWAGGCASCHAAENAGGDERLLLGGGLALNTPFGTFRVPNISTDPTHGIGAWTTLDFVNAMKRGVAPGGVHLYPAFPYTSYQRMTFEDIIDLKAFLDTLPAVATPNQSHALSFPYNVRRGLGLWQLLYVDSRTFLPDAEASDQVNRGAYLVLGPGHCGECHTPRGFDGGLDWSRAFAGGPTPEGEGRIPNITPHTDGIGSWSETDIVAFLESGFTPDFDSAGRQMADVVKNMAMLPAEDRAAIAAYLKTIAPLPSGS